MSLRTILGRLIWSKSQYLPKIDKEENKIISRQRREIEFLEKLQDKKDELIAELENRVKESEAVNFNQTLLTLGLKLFTGEKINTSDILKPNTKGKVDYKPEMKSINPISEQELKDKIMLIPKDKRELAKKMPKEIILNWAKSNLGLNDEEAEKGYNFLMSS